MTNTQMKLQPSRLVALVAAVLIAACTPAPKSETKVAGTDTTAQQPMKMPMEMPMDMSKGMKGGCPLNPASITLTAAQKATFDSVRTEHHAAMQKEMDVAIARARAVLTKEQRVQFDSIATAHKAMMEKMMSSGGCSM